MQSSFELRKTTDQLKLQQDNEKSCDICLEVYSRKDNVLPCTITCGHTLCNQCLEAFIQQRRECAFCRKQITVKEAIPNYDFLNVIEEREQEISAYNRALEQVTQEANKKLKLVEQEIMKKLSLNSENTQKQHEMELRRLNQKSQEEMHRKETELQLRLQKEQELHLENLNHRKDEEMRQAIKEMNRKNKEEKLQKLEKRRFDMRVRTGIIKLDDSTHDSTQNKRYRKRMNHPGVLWAWESPKGWITFDQDRNNVIEENFHLGSSSCETTYKGMKFYIDIENWLSKRRPNDINPARIKRVNNVPGSAKWFFIKKYGQQEELSPQSNFDIELAWQNNEAEVIVQENSEAYKCDLESLRCVRNEFPYLLVRISMLD